MRNIAEFTLIGRVGTIKQVGKIVRVSICANYPFKDDKGQWKDDSHWNDVTIFTKAIQSYVASTSARATWSTRVDGSGRTAMSAMANGSTRSISSLWTSADWRKRTNAPRHSAQRGGFGLLIAPA